MDELKDRLVAYIANENKNENSVMVTNQRHYDALLKAEAAIANVQEMMLQDVPTDLLTQDIKTALRHIGEITGDIDIDKDILGTIFGKFCVGK
jgi:tRNA modification GTPase